MGRPTVWPPLWWARFRLRRAHRRVALELGAGLPADPYPGPREPDGLPVSLDDWFRWHASQR